MEDKIAVQCETEKEWDAVVKKSGVKNVCSAQDVIDSYGAVDKNCIMLDDRFNPRESCIRDGYTIISAVEYLNEGGKDVKKIKIGDKVVRGPGWIWGGQDGGEGGVGKVIRSSVESWWIVRWENGSEQSYPYKAGEYGLKIISNKTQTTKENNMKDNGIDSNVLAIFGDKLTGNEVVVIDRHFTEQMLTRILMEKHHKAIQEACVLAEAKRLEKEEKDNN